VTFFRAVGDLCAGGILFRDILHLCGCGLPSAEGTARYRGCCEPDHLVLGSREQNTAHRNFHSVVSQVSLPQDYKGVVRVCNRDVQYCGDTF
jgi:hypothetical protein